MANDFENENVEDQEEQQKLTLTVTVEEKSSCERHVKIETSREDVDRYFDREYDSLQQEAAIPGFRPGKAPRKLVEKRFRNEVKTRVKASLIQDALVQADEDENMTPIGEPQFNFDSIEIPVEGPFVFEYDIEVRPTFDIPNWKGLKIERPVHEYTSEEIDAAIKRVQMSQASLVDKGAPAEVGDFIVSKLTFRLDDKVLNQAEHETICIRPTLSFHDCAINDFDKLMVGAVPGDVRQTKLTISEKSLDENLRGKEIDATFEISAVQVKVVPEVDDDFLRKIGGFTNVGDFRDAVLDTLERQLSYEQQRVARRQIVAQLTADATWQLPPNLLKNQAGREMNRAILELRRSGFTDEQIVRQLNVLRQNSEVVTAQALKEHFILEAIAESEGLDVDEADIETEILLISSQTNKSPRRVRSEIERAGDMDILRNQIIERKVINLIQKSAEFVETPYVPEELAEEAVDFGVGSGDSDGIPEVSEEEAKEAARAAAESARN